jgi:thioester reductase-like protein
MSSRDQPTILLTGSTGVLGQALVAELDDFDLVCLTHRRSLDLPGVVEVKGDIARDDLGLGRSRYEELRDCVQAVIHCAALTNFTAPPDEIESTNVEGTEHMGRFAQAAGAAFYQVSTAFVHPATRTAAHSEAEQAADADEAGPSPAAYVESKAEAEQVVEDEPFPSVIFRPSILAGDTESGEISEFQGLQVLVGHLIKGRLPLLPASPDAHVDFVPRDYVARAIATVVRAAQEVALTEELWLTAGTSALTVEAVVDHCMELAEQFTGSSPKRPRMVDPEIVDRLIRPGILSELPDDVAQQLELLFKLMPLVNTDRPFPSSIDQLRDRYDIEPLPDLDMAFCRSAQYWAETTGFSRRERVG